MQAKLLIFYKMCHKTQSLFTLLSASPSYLVISIERLFLFYIFFNFLLQTSPAKVREGFTSYFLIGALPGYHAQTVR